MGNFDENLNLGKRVLPPPVFFRYWAPLFVWAPQAKRMHHIVPIDFENVFSLLLMGTSPLRHPLSTQAPKFC